MEETVVKKRYFRTGNYLVVEEKKTMVCIYLNQIGYRKKLLTSRGNWKSAVKLARLLESAYEMGRREDDWEDCW